MSRSDPYPSPGVTSESGALVSFALIQGQGLISGGRIYIESGSRIGISTGLGEGQDPILPPQATWQLCRTLLCCSSHHLHSPTPRMQGAHRKFTGMSWAGQYLNTCAPQPAIKVKKRGGRSRDGLMAYPEFMPRDDPMMITRMPITRACVPCSAGLFSSSVMAERHSWSIPVTITWGKDAVAATLGH